MTKTDAATPATQAPTPHGAPPHVHSYAPGLGWYTDNVVFGDSWERPPLSKRDRSVVTVAALIACGHVAQMTGHFNRALQNGVKPKELVEIVTHLAFYNGWPSSISAVGVMRDVFPGHGINPEQLLSRTGLAPAAPGRANVAEATPADVAAVAPAIAEYHRSVLAGDLWHRADLSPRDRSLITITAMVATTQHEPLRTHVLRGLDNGLSQIEIVEAVTHLSFYVGFPRAMSAVAVLKAAFESHKKT